MSELSNTRIGRITSSEIVSLVSNGTKDGSFGKPFHTYVDECIMERFFAQNLENDSEVKAFAWGKLCELIVHEKLPMSYEMQSEITEIHPLYPEWVGTPDGKITINGKVDTVTDIKCPLTRKGFYELIKYLYDFNGVEVVKKQNVDGDYIINEIRKNSKIGEKYYWQLVSNACILDAEYAELIVFAPYYDELTEIRQYNETLETPYWLIHRSKNEELPFIYRERGIENINTIRFKIPQEDKDKLTKRVLKAIELINK